MLQQTTVATVIPYYHRFLKSFPTVEALAAAPLERVLEHWSGLGYYARARNLHAAAKRVAGDFGGVFPSDKESVLSLPGVGPYTAGALLSFAYDRPEALVDGNVVRVLSRIYGVTENTKDPAVLKKIWGLARAVVPQDGARHFNSALMDLGATVCRPAAASCMSCAFFKSCWARRNNRQEEVPLIISKLKRKTIHMHAGLMENDGRLALVQRAGEGLYGGLWEFPTESTAGNRVSSREIENIFRRQWGKDLRAEKHLPTIRHVLTHRDLFVTPWVLAAKEMEEKPALRWFAAEDVDKLAISSLTRRILKEWRRGR